MNKTCQKCGTPNLSQAVFCQNCASPLNAASQAPPQQAWPQTPVGGPVVGGHQMRIPAQQESQRPMISMILAIAAFFCCGPLLGIPAAILGWLELDSIKNGRSPQSGKTMATVGLWGGIAATILHSAGWILWIFLGALASNPYGY